MGKNKRNHFVGKVKNRCDFCSKIVSSNDFIHKKCVYEWLTKNGYIVLKNAFVIQEVQL